MDYSRHYDLLIHKARNRILEGYSESHHILPRCIGGIDAKSNLVSLTPEEHYVAHQLLVKIYPNNSKLVRAAAMMIPNRKSNKLYGWLRRKFGKIQSENVSGSKNPHYGKMWIHNNALKISKRIYKNQDIPEGWLAGRVENWDKKQNPKKMSRPEMLQQRKENTKKIAHELFDSFMKSNYNSICEFAKANNTTQPRLSALWKKYVEDYNTFRVHGKPFKN